MARGRFGDWKRNGWGSACDPHGRGEAEAEAETGVGYKGEEHDRPRFIGAFGNIVHLSASSVRSKPAAERRSHALVQHVKCFFF